MCVWKKASPGTLEVILEPNQYGICPEAQSGIHAGEATLPAQQKRSIHQTGQDYSGWKLLPSELGRSCAELVRKSRECWWHRTGWSEGFCHSHRCSVWCTDFGAPLFTCRPASVSSLSCVRCLAGTLALSRHVQHGECQPSRCWDAFWWGHWWASAC